jgi:hypothetical protein
MSIFARLLILLALLMLVLPAPLKASCCPDPAQASGQMPEAPPCHGHADDGKVPADNSSGCAGDCCPCRAPADLPMTLVMHAVAEAVPVLAHHTPALPGALRIPPLPPPIA